MTDINSTPADMPSAMVDDGVSARGESRDSLFLQADVFVDGSQTPFKVRVRNLSAGGLLAEAPTPVAEGAIVGVALPNIGPMSGRCVWSGEGRFGIAFDRQIDPQAVRRKPGSRTDLPASLVGMTLHTSKFKKPLRPI